MSDTKTRCEWPGLNEIYIKYHDEEWGVPVGQASSTDRLSSKPARAPRTSFSSLNVSKDMSPLEKKASAQHDSFSEQELAALKARHDDKTQFEFLILEGAQAGLNWLTILKRRDGYRRVFRDFEVDAVAAMSEDDIQAALLDEGIIRNKLKVRAAVKNAQVFQEIQQEFGSFTEYIWSFVEGKPIINAWETIHDSPTTSKESDALSRDLKKRGMSFVGSTIMYAHMQATGMVNDHIVSCFRYNEVDE